MRVRLRTIVAGPSLTASPGDIISLDGNVARVLIAEAVWSSSLKTLTACTGRNRHC
jgi:hypothetical protein